MVNVINVALKHLGSNRQASAQEVDGFLGQIDQNKDGKLTKPELFTVFKRISE